MEQREDRNSMTFSELLAWAWRETPPVHKNAANLIIHIFAVPAFVIGHVLSISAFFVNLWMLVLGVSIIVVSLLLQTFGHSLETNKVPAFTGPGDFLRRLYAEQFCNFWRFLFTGQWFRSFKAQV